MSERALASSVILAIDGAFTAVRVLECSVLIPTAKGWNARRHQGNMSCIMLFSGFDRANSDAFVAWRINRVLDPQTFLNE